VTGIKNRVEFLGKAYAAGSKAFEESDEMKKTIGDINKKIYDRDPSLMALYKETRQWSLDYFETIYKTVGSRFDRYYFESEVFEKGRATVFEALKKGIFEKRDGAVIFPGEKYGLHNRVFVTTDGNATYEAKDIGLARLQFDEYHPDLIIHCVGPEQASYFQVLFQALEQVFPDTAGKEYHLKYGWVKLKTGKMSSRLGNVVLGEWLIDEVKKAINTILEQSISKDKEVNHTLASETIAIGAIKYSFLKVSTPMEIAFDLQESINTNGDSGPYLQYAYARCRSVIRKAAEAQNPKSKNQNNSKAPNSKSQPFEIDSFEFPLDLELGALDLNKEERAVARRIMQFSDIVTAAAQNYAPNTLCTYLFQLAQEFNLFYAKHTILGNSSSFTVHGSSTKQKVSDGVSVNSEPITVNPQSATRIALTAAVAQVLKNGLYLLGINVMERM
jgi:arginyl-tRNA synthetase